MPISPLMLPVCDPRMIYSKDEFLRRTGLRPAAYCEEKRNGLVVRYKHKRAFIIGQDWLDYLQRDDDENGGKSG
jgi:hypothetical protein